jgi:hypothetical protein
MPATTPSGTIQAQKEKNFSTLAFAGVIAFLITKGR